MVSNFLFMGGTTGVLPGRHASGGFTIDTGGLTVTAGNVGVGNVPSSFAGIDIQSAITGSSAQAEGIIVRPTLTAGANSDVLSGIQVSPTYNTNGKTGVACYGMNIPGPTGSGAVNVYTLLVGTPSGGSGQNIGIIVQGGGIAVTAGGITVQAGGLNVSAGGLSVSAGNTNYGPGELTGNAGSASMTTGFIWLPSASAAPTGAPSAGFSGRAPMYYDSNLKKFWIWDGSWRGVLVT